MIAKSQRHPLFELQRTERYRPLLSALRGIFACTNVAPVSAHAEREPHSLWLGAREPGALAFLRDFDVDRWDQAKV